jgi:hypothetical protein
MLSVPSASAGRVGGPMSETIVVPARQSATYDIHFAAGEQAVITVAGNGVTNLDLFVYDADGHVIVGEGRYDRKTARLDVYRTGSFRVEVRNLGPMDNTVLLMTN